MTIGVYGIFDSRNNTCLYVGQSKTIEQRWKSHLNSLRRAKHKCHEFNLFYQNIENESVLDFRILEECQDDDRIKNSIEIKWFNILEPRFYGKVPSTNERWTHSELTKEKISGRSNSRKRNCLVCGESFLSIRAEVCGQLCRKNRRLLEQGLPPIIKQETRLHASFNKFSQDQLFQLWIIDDIDIFELAKALSCSNMTAYRILKHHGLPTTKYEARKIATDLDPLSEKVCEVCRKNLRKDCDPRNRTCSRICGGKLAAINSGKNISNDNSSSEKGLGKKTGGLYSSHSRWHTSRNIVNPECEVCKNNL